MFRIGMRVAAGIIGCAYFVLLTTGLIPTTPLKEVVPQCAMMALLLVYGLFGQRAADTLLTLVFPQPTQKPTATSDKDERNNARDDLPNNDGTH